MKQFLNVMMIYLNHRINENKLNQIGEFIYPIRIETNNPRYYSRVTNDDEPPIPTGKNEI
jgi:hypothetical protein